MHSSDNRLGRLLVPELVAIAMLDWALVVANPLGHFIVWRLVICGVFVYLAIEAYKLNKKTPWVWIFTLSAIVYNPLIRFYLTKDEWSLVNIAAIFIIATSVFHDLFQRLTKHRSPRQEKAASDKCSSTGVVQGRSTEYVYRTYDRDKNVAENWHMILGVPKDASLIEIRSAYKKKVSKYHPDKVTQLGEEIHAVAEQKTKEINIAFNRALRDRL